MGIGRANQLQRCDVLDSRFPNVIEAYEGDVPRLHRRNLWAAVLDDPRDDNARLAWSDIVQELADELPIGHTARYVFGLVSELTRLQTNLSAMPDCKNSLCPASVNSRDGFHCSCGRKPILDRVEYLSKCLTVNSKGSCRTPEGDCEDSAPVSLPTMLMQSILPGATLGTCIVTHGHVSALASTPVNWFRFGSTIVSRAPVRFVYFPDAIDELTELRNFDIVQATDYQYWLRSLPHMYPFDGGHELNDTSIRMSMCGLFWARRRAGFTDIDPSEMDGKVSGMLRLRREIIRQLEAGGQQFIR